METISIREVIEIVATVFTTFIGYKAKDIYIWLKNKQFKLIEHEFFNEILFINNEIRSWKIPPNKQVFIDALKILLDSWYQKGAEFAQAVDNKKFSPFTIEKKTMQWLTHTIDYYNQKWQDAGIPKVIIDKINQSQQRKIQIFSAAFQKIAHNDIYITNKQKFIAILDKLLTLLIETKLEFYDMIFGNFFNGELKGIKYKGIPIHDDEYKYFLKSNKDKDKHA